MNLKAFLPAIVAAMMLALPATSEAGRTYYTNRDHDGHFVKHHADWDHHHGHYYGNGYYGGYYCYPYRYGYGRPCGYPYYGYGYGPSIGLSFYSRQAYYSSRVYRGSVVDNSLAADVQRALRRQGYCYG